MRRLIKEGKTSGGRETAVVAAPQNAELFMRPRFSSHHETKSEIVLLRQPGSQSPSPKQTISIYTVFSRVNPPLCRNVLQCETLYLSCDIQFTKIERMVWGGRDLDLWTSSVHHWVFYQNMFFASLCIQMWVVTCQQKQSSPILPQYV